MNSIIMRTFIRIRLKNNIRNTNKKGIGPDT
ncbi:hypothetical protein NIASO_15565 [Niabella soli DSM 19437]|uniref:Uncharacterized protein n=1 Tax=Niabella soli DSM 19437 TaxID=929713 RepID=W0F910_9BACT|nr:hypothetical protein NIASO_15565 [Niabella soli DSM 19437]